MGLSIQFNQRYSLPGIKKYFLHAQNFEPPSSKMAIQMIWILAQHELASYKVKDSKDLNMH